MTDQSPSIPSCEVCSRTYDLEARIPRVIPCCGETLCRECLEERRRNNAIFRCPWCKYVHKATAEFKTNFLLLEEIEENLKWGICPEHGEAVKLFCLQDRRKVCASCQTRGGKAGCRDHDLVSLASVKHKADKGRKKFENHLEMLEKKYQELDKKLTEDEKTMEEMICNYFDEQQSSLQASKIKVLHDFNIACATERTNFDRCFGQESTLRNELKNIISDHMNSLKNPDPKEIINRDYSNLQNRLNYFLSSNSNGLSFEQQLSQVVPKLTHNIFEQSMTMHTSLDSFAKNVTKEITKKIPSGFENSEDDSDCRNDKLAFTSYLNFTIEKSSFVIAECEEEIETELSRTDLRKVREVVFKFGTLDLSCQDWNVISQVYNEIGSKHCIAVRFVSDSKDWAIKSLSKLFSIFFQKPEDIVGVSLYLNFNDELMQLLNFILPQLSILKILRLTIEDAKISLKHFNEFIKSLHSLAPRLEVLYFNLSKMRLPLSILKEIFIKMPILKTFYLNVSEIKNLNAETISPLLNDSKKRMPMLEKLTLDLSQTEIPVSDSPALKDRFRHLQTFDLILKNSENTKRTQNQASQSQRSPSQTKQSLNPFQSANPQYLTMTRHFQTSQSQRIPSHAEQPLNPFHSANPEDLTQTKLFSNLQKRALRQGVDLPRSSYYY